MKEPSKTSFMPKMTINIINDKINLITGWSQIGNNNKTSISFNTTTSENANITVAFTRMNEYPSDVIDPKIDVGSGFVSISGDSWTGSLPNGTATVRFDVADPIKPQIDCNGGSVRVTDNTNVESESREFARCRNPI